MTDKLELKSCHEVIDTVNVADVDSIFHGKPEDPDILTVVLKSGRRLYCDEVCPIDSLQEEPVSNPINFEKELYKAFGQVKDFTLGMRIANWFYDMGKNSQEPVSEELIIELKSIVNIRELALQGIPVIKIARHIANWQKEKDQETIELAEDHAMLAGMEKMKEEMMAKAVEVTVHIDAGGYPYIPQIELYDYDKDAPLAKEGDKYKVVLIKEDRIC